ncbi:type II toxin-antitoxin system RelB/DinJ family antitoxin [Xylocopilactobacillus apicola]|uniref:Toxin-antitoxin system protein n=1 Tax=Xylocopilactobacillus apicola TaxID=2932184 RepID=A0AAU9D2C4_9LACO|nr:type II toxin-antitoxin system RelB/DinJ family antitoxin [Xylocopilactobacillus apicola]BDR57658.1 toxin-antitoxin system protein [Xylocopilactobacillus apicola]
MQNTSKRTESIYARVTPELKRQAEEVLNQLQIPMTTAINMFLQQVVNTNEIPFKVKTAKKPLDLNSLSKDEFNQEIQKGIDDLAEGRTYTLEEVKAKIFGDGK